VNVETVSYIVDGAYLQFSILLFVIIKNFTPSLSVSNACLQCLTTFDMATCTCIHVEIAKGCLGGLCGLPANSTRAGNITPI